MYIVSTFYNIQMQTGGDIEQNKKLKCLKNSHKT